MRDDLTIIYYTGNYERPKFEENIRKELVKAANGLPIISVSQKPIDLGNNICVGEVGRSEQNLFRQLQIGAQTAKTRFICTAESDLIYPEEYFHFVPPRDDTFYFAKPLYVCFNQRGKGRSFCPKQRGSEAAMVINRELVIREIEKLFRIMGITDMWGPMRDQMFLFRKRHGQLLEYFIMEKAAITFKTDSNMHRRTPHNRKIRLKELPYWGEVHDLIARLST